MHRKEDNKKRSEQTEERSDINFKKFPSARSNQKASQNRQLLPVTPVRTN